MARLGEHAVVLGAGMGGLLAARVLSTHYDRVTVVERDELPNQPEARKGVPQGRHVHGLLPRGKDLLEKFFPGLVSELVADGAVECDALQEVRFNLAGYQLKRIPTGYTALQASRPFLEHHVRRRVAALPGVVIRDGLDAAGLLHDSAAGRVIGVRVWDADHSTEEDLRAGLTVASMGRGSAVNTWLDGLGYGRPAEEGAEIDIVYSSAYVRLPEGALAGDKMITIGVRDMPPRALALFAVDGNRHILTLIGFGGERPPRDAEQFAEFVGTFAPRDVFDAIKNAEILSPVSTFRYKANKRRRYERMTDFPGGLLVTGDTLCSFSPVYGQGMTVAAIQMDVLRRCLARGDRHLARRFYRRVTSEIDNAWRLTVVADNAMPHVTADSVPDRVAALALDPMLAAAARDGIVAEKLFGVIGLVESPTALLHPKVTSRIGVANAFAQLDRSALAAARLVRSMRQ
ncbi:FAD-dependent oxidoreductase [Aldersonia kunmingensis]|uniref:FAD-dependent oxidoreductase n=1 Tax=Aldersonia kunmingensis TaxID=408066 RepID=UPI0012EECE2C|nr:FAD-dependent monooxygenase [Aldersonia kunmingensis]